MTVCAARALKPDGSPETCGFFTSCSPCRCGAEVREELEGHAPNTVLRDLLDARAARVPDSARGNDGHQ